MQAYSNFDQLLYRYLTVQTNGDERDKMNAWLEIVRSRYGAELKLSKDAEERLFRLISDPSKSIGDVIAFNPVLPRRNWMKRLFERWC